MIKPGDKVIVNVTETSQVPNNPVKKYHGKEFIVDHVKIHYTYNHMIKKQYTLEGCESEYGLPYWFTDKELIKVGDDL